MKFKVSEEEGIVVLSPAGRMWSGSEGLYEMHDKIRELVRIGARRMVIDLGEVERVDSRGLGILIAAFVSLKNAGGELKLARIKKVKSLIVQTHLIEVFKICNSVEEALKAFQSEGVVREASS